MSQPKFTQLEYDEDTLTVRINGVLASRVTEPVNGPIIIEHRLVHAGRPTSLLDVAHCYATASDLLTKWMRVVPVDRDFGRHPLEILSRPELYQVVHHSDLHAEFLSTLKWRGRPSSFLQFRFDVLREWRDKVFSGDLTIRDIAKLARVSEPAAARFAHAETIWWL